MYLCPICGKEYKSDAAVAKCFLRCWREQNPNYRSKEAPHSDDIVTRQCNDDVANFFTQFGKGGANGN